MYKTNTTILLLSNRKLKKLNLRRNKSKMGKHEIFEMKFSNPDIEIFEIFLRKIVR
jgi:hypothetical protein